MSDKKIVVFNAKNLKYAKKTESGYGEWTEYGEGLTRTVSIQANASAKTIYGDGVVQLKLPNEKPLTGSFSTNTVSDGYEMMCGRVMVTSDGSHADIRQVVSIPHALYFETDAATKTGKVMTAKVILWNVTSTRPNSVHNQNTEDINETTFETPTEIAGEYALASSSSNTKAKDQFGNEIIVFKQTYFPEDSGYSTAGTGTPSIPVATGATVTI